VDWCLLAARCLLCIQPSNSNHHHPVACPLSVISVHLSVCQLPSACLYTVIRTTQKAYSPTRTAEYSPTHTLPFSASLPLLRAPSASHPATFCTSCYSPCCCYPSCISPTPTLQKPSNQRHPLPLPLFPPTTHYRRARRTRLAYTYIYTVRTSHITLRVSYYTSFSLSFRAERPHIPPRQIPPCIG
jgi:hypothetical protein